MIGVNKILVPIDFSVCSEHALRFSMKLADKFKANLILLNVLSFDSNDMVNPISVSWAVDEQTSQSRRRMETSIQKAIDIVGSSINEAPLIQTNIEIGKAEAVICTYAIKNQVDYIVMGTQGENHTLDKYLGDVSSNVLKNAPCPIILIPEDTEITKKVVIGYATSLSDADPFEIWKAVKLFEPYQHSEIKCIHFHEELDLKENRIKEFETYFAETAPELKITFYSFPIKDKVKDMNDFIENENINILVMYKPKRAFFESIFHKSYTKKMARHTNIPLLVLPEF